MNLCLRIYFLTNAFFLLHERSEAFLNTKPHKCNIYEKPYFSVENRISRNKRPGLQQSKKNYEVQGTKELKLNVSRLLETHANDESILNPLLINIYEKALEACKNKEPTKTEIPKYQPLPSHLAPMRRFLRTSFNEKEHEGCFQVFENHLTSLPPALLFSMDQPFSFIQEKLSYHFDQERMNTMGGMLYDNSEAVVFCVSKDQNLEYTSRVLDNMPLAQLHLGIFPDCQVDLDLEIVEKLESLKLLDESTSTTNKAEFRYTLHSHDLDVIQSLLSFQNDNQNQQQGHQTVVKLIEEAVESTRKGLLGNSNETPSLTICAHSTNASIIASALSAWKQQKVETSSYSKRYVEALLHTAVTVVTFGNICQKFCDGPAYIHISMHDDKLSQTFGCSLKKSQGGGRDAVYLHTWSPYNPWSTYEHTKDEIKNLKEHDSHNMNSCMIQFLYLVMRINGITSFRELYNEARYIDPLAIYDISPRNFLIDYSRHKLGELVIAPNMDDQLLPAMIAASFGERCLWNSSPLGLLPDEDESKCYLEEYLGYDAFEDITVVCADQSKSTIC